MHCLKKNAFMGRLCTTTISTCGIQHISRGILLTLGRDEELSKDGELLRSGMKCVLASHSMVTMRCGGSR